VDAWKQYQQRSNRHVTDLARCCYHLPFTKIAEKAHERLCKADGLPVPDETVLNNCVRGSLHYNRVTGNTYTASLYEGLCSLLDHDPEDLAGQRIGLFSYGSGCMAEYFSGVVQPGYRNHLFSLRHKNLLDSRLELSYQQYEDIFNYGIPTDGQEHPFAQYKTGPFRLSGVKEHKRLYEVVT